MGECCKLLTLKVFVYGERALVHICKYKEGDRAGIFSDEVESYISIIDISKYHYVSDIVKQAYGVNKVDIYDIRFA